MSDEMSLFLGRSPGEKVITRSDGREWSPQQLAIFEAIVRGKGNVAIRARAGAAKSTTILEAARRLPSGTSAGLTAFNKAIAEELKRKAPRGLDVKTFHAIGYGLLKQHDRATVIDKDKGINLAREIVGPAASPKLAVAVKRAAAMLKSYLVQQDDLARAMEVLAEHEIEAAPWADAEALAGLAFAAMAAARQMTGIVDFDDQVWLPIVLGLKPSHPYDVVFVDEAQDMAENQLRLAFSLAGDTGRIVVVFDEMQAIYTWRGAGGSMFKRILDQLKPTEFPLPITYRCPLAVVREAQKYVPDLRPAAWAEEGIVERIPAAEMLKRLRPGDFVVSRLNAALVTQCTAAIRAGIKANIQGRDLGQTLSAMVHQAQADSVEDLVKWIEAWRMKETARRQAKDQDTQPVTDKAECLLAFADGMKSVGEVLRNIAVMFADEDDGTRVVFSSVHRAKGLERERVFLLEDTFMLKRPRTDPATGKTEWISSIEETCLIYVAITRSARELYFVQGTRTRPQ